MTSEAASLDQVPSPWAAFVVRLKDRAASSLDIEVMAWFDISDWSESRRIRQEVLPGFPEVVARAGTSFAFPPRTLHLETSDSERDVRMGDRGIRQANGRA